MEIRFDDVTYKNKYKDMDFSIYSKYIYGICLEDSITFEKLLTKELSVSKGKITFKGMKRKKPIVTVVDSSYIHFFTDTIKSEINYYCKKNKVTDKSFKEFLEKYLENIGLEISILNKKISELSTSEKYLFYVFLKTLFKFDVVIFRNLYFNLDKNNRRNLKNILSIFSSNGKVVIIEDNLDVLYEVTDKVLVIKNGSVLLNGDTKEELINVSLLLNNSIVPPTLPYITYLAKENKNVKLFYHTDIRDIIKDIYKHV